MYSATSELDMYVKSTISNVMLQYLWCYGAVSNLKSDCADTRPKPSQGTVHMPMSSRDLDCIGVHLSKSERERLTEGAMALTQHSRRPHRSLGRSFRFIIGITSTVVSGCSEPSEMEPPS
jgi:hypothetical protein